MQTEGPHRRCCRLDPIRDELSPQAAERFDKLALFDQLRIEGASQAIGCSRATPCRWKRRLREPGVGALNTRAGRIRALLQRLPAASGARTSGAHAGA